jgi:uncharacterized protein (TIGR02996 family)
MPFTDEQPFLDAIFARYADDGPRLVYADFLDEAGDPARAELVRVQIALSHMSDDHPRRPTLTERQAELIAAHSARWTEHLGTLVVSGQFRRGVLDSVVVDSASFIENGEELFRRACIRCLRLRDANPVIHKLILSALLAEVRELDLCGNELGNAGVELLVRSQFLQNIDDLNLADNWLDDSGVQALSRSSTLPRLSVLALNNNEQITSEGIKALADSPFFAGLTTLDISRCDVNDSGVRAIVGSKAFSRLHTLRLAGNHIGDAGVTALAKSSLLVRMLGRVPKLELSANSIGAEGAAALAASPALANCTTLDLSGNYLGNEGFAAIMASPRLSKLHTLKLGGNQITDAGLVSIRHNLPALFSKLRSLDLSENRLTRYGQGLLEAAKGDAATILDLSGNVQTSVGGEAPVPVGRVVPEVLRGVTEVADAAELRRRVAHPTMRPGERQNPTNS